MPRREGPSRTGRNIAWQTRGSGRGREADELGESEKGHKGRLRSVGVMPESLRSCQSGELVNDDLTWVSMAAGLEGREGSRGTDVVICAHLQLQFPKPAALGSSCWQVFRSQPFPFFNGSTKTQTKDFLTLLISESPSVVNGFSQVSPGLAFEVKTRNPLPHFCT